MTIRGRVTLWYSAALLASLLLGLGGMYYELVYERDRARQNRQPQDPVEEEVGEAVLIYALPAMIVTVVGGWWLLRRSLAPLDQLTRAAERIDPNNLRESLPRSFNGDEVDRLSQVLNATNQRLSAAMNEIHEFTLHASHELKTPLTILHSEIETALGTWTISGAQKESLASQLDEIQRLTRIVEALGLMARADSGQVNFEQEPVAFHELVHDTIEDAAVLARPREIKIKVDRVDEAWVTGDRRRLRQMLLNLLDNAAKYNHHGGTILISARADASTVTFEISNTGPGIQPEDLPHVFKKFHRGKTATPNDPGGVGLGLSIAQSIARAHRGKIEIGAATSGLTTFRVILPKKETGP